MKKLILSCLLVILSLPAQATEKEKAFDRIMKAETIRCGYGTFKPWIYHDSATNDLTGFVVDIMEEIGRQSNLKLTWGEEISWGEFATALYSGRVDVACSTMWNDPARARQIMFTDPLFYTAVHAWSRTDDNRFSSNKDINKPDIRIAVQDGDFTYGLAKRLFPQAQLVTIPQGAAWGDIMLNVTTKKADILFIDVVSVMNFNETNETKLKKVPLKDPVAVYGNTLAVSIREPELKEFLNANVRYLIQSGKLEELTAPFLKTYPDSLILPRKPY